MLHDLAPAVDPLGLLREQGEKPELRRCQLHLAAVERDLVAPQVERERPHPLERVPTPGAVEVAPPQQRADAADSSAMENGFVT